MAVLRRSTVLLVCLTGPAVITGEPSALPGPGFDVPVDADGDGLSTYGDRYAFNYWLGLGGSLASAISAAEAGKNGVIDLSRFFSSPEAVLVPQSTAVDVEPAQEAAAGGGALSSCATSASIVAPFGAPTTPASLFTSCKSQLRYATGADMDAWQGLWCSRREPQDELAGGVVLLDLSQGPPMGNDGTIPARVSEDHKFHKLLRGRHRCPSKPGFQPVSLVRRPLANPCHVDVASRRER